MSEWSEKAQAINTFIRPLTFPIAARVVKSVDEFPERARRPLRDMGFKTNICVGMTLARKYGWTVGFTAEDNACRTATYAYGWSESEPESEKGILDFMLTMNYAANQEAARSIVETVKQFKLNKGQYAGVVFSPLERTVIEPQIVLVFCNPAQLMRLVHGAAQESGKSIQSVFCGRYGSCTDGILQVLKVREPKVVLPGNGERVWAAVQDDEMLFAIPVEALEQVIRGLEATHRTGVRYPIPVDVRHEPNFPAARRT